MKTPRLADDVLKKIGKPMQIKWLRLSEEAKTCAYFVITGCTGGRLDF
jgi:hypothetical protein